LHDIIEAPLPAVCKQLCSTAVSCDLSEHSIARKNYMDCGVDFSVQATCSIIFSANTFVMMIILMLKCD